MPTKPRKTAAAKDAALVVTPLHEMAPRDRARTIMKLDETRAGLLKLAKESVTIKTADGKDNYDATHAARMKLKNTRISIEKAGKAARDDATKFGKEVIAVEKELIDLISPEEERLQKLQDVADAAIEAERAAAKKREDERRAAIGARITAMQTAPLQVMGRSAREIEAKLEWLADEDDETFEGEDLDRAKMAKRTSLAQLRAMFEDARRREEQAAEDARRAKEIADAQKEIADAQAALAERAAQIEQQERTLTAKLGDTAEPHKVQPLVEEVLRETGDTLATADVPPKAQDPVQGNTLHAQHEAAAEVTYGRLNVPATPMERVHQQSPEAELRDAIKAALDELWNLTDPEPTVAEADLRIAANRYFNTEEF